MGDSKLDIEICFEFALNLTKEAGKLIAERIWGTKTIDYKSCQLDMVTETDKEIETILISSLKKRFPDHKFIGEESVAAGESCTLTDDPVWIIDPVDGTMNFVHGYPNVCVSVALWAEKVAQVGIIFNPVTNQLFTAVRGKGACLNGNPIRVSNETDLGKALVGMEFGTSDSSEKRKVVIENTQTLVPCVHGLRSSGSCAINMALTALGALDGSFEFGIHCWDVAAGALIITEAGGVILSTDGSEFDVMSRRYLAAGTRELAERLVKTISVFDCGRD